MEETDTNHPSRGTRKRRHIRRHKTWQTSESAEKAIRLVSLGIDQDGKQIRKSTTYTPKASDDTPQKQMREVQAFAAEFERQVKDGEYYDGDNLTVEQYSKIWLDSIEGAVTQRVLEGYESQFQLRIIPEIGFRKLAQVRPLHLQTMYKKFKNLTTGDPLSPATIAKIHNQISSMFNAAYRQGLVKENPCNRVTLTRQSNTKMKFFNTEEAQRFLHALKLEYTYKTKERIRIDSSGKAYQVKSYERKRKEPLTIQAFFTLAVYSGARRGEITALTRKDVDFEHGVVSIQKAATRTKKYGQIIKDTKSAASRRLVTISQEAVFLLRDLKNEQMRHVLEVGSYWTGKRGREYDENYIFTLDDGHMFSMGSASREIHRIIKMYNDQYAQPGKELPDIRLHDLRHTNATLLLSNGTDIETVAHRLGHARASVTLNVYGHALPQRDIEASETLSQSLRIRS